MYIYVGSTFFRFFRFLAIKYSYSLSLGRLPLTPIPAALPTVTISLTTASVDAPVLQPPLPPPRRCCCRPRSRCRAVLFLFLLRIVPPVLTAVAVVAYPGPTSVPAASPAFALLLPPLLPPLSPPLPPSLPLLLPPPLQANFSGSPPRDVEICFRYL